MKSSSLNAMKLFFSLQYFKLIREENENAEEWMDYLRIKANECGYKEKAKRFKRAIYKW